MTIGAERGDGKRSGRPSGEVQVLARAIEILRVLGEASADLTLAQIADQVDLPRSTVHRIVRTLRDANFVVSGAANEGLRLGPELGRLAAVSRIQLVPMVRPFLEDLSSTLTAGASLAVLEGESVRFLDQAISGHGIRAVSVVGSTFPAHCTANGKALLAELTIPQLEAKLPRRLERLTPHTIGTRGALIEELERVRESGVAVDREEHAVGISAMGRVIRDGVGNLAAVTVPMPAEQFGEREVEVERALTAMTAQVDAALARSPILAG